MRSLLLAVLLMIATSESPAVTTCASQTTDPAASQMITLTASDPAACQFYEISSSSVHLTMDEAGELAAAIVLLLGVAFSIRSVRRTM